MSAGTDVGKRLDDALTECIDASVVVLDADNANSVRISIPANEWSRLVQGAARAVGYLTWEESSP